jgi:uncharacterized protein YqjF (DUF2071 family)
MLWRHLLFLHWSWDAHQIQATLPAGLFVDTYEGRAWLAIVPLFMQSVHPTGFPSLPWVSNFLELNVRTYVHDGAGLPGIWFYSLVCNQPLAVELARRWYHLNYVHARMKASVDQDGICSYKVRRGSLDEASFAYGSSAADEIAEPGSLEFFLIERYVLFSAARNGRLYAGRVHHPQYRIGPGLLEEWSFIPAVADGFPNPARSPDHVRIAAALDVQAWAIRKHSPAGK